MNYPPIFYFTEKSSETGYGLTPQGSLNVGRLANGKPYWKKQSAVGKQKKKSLILADWTAINWSEEKIDAIKLKIGQLLDDGFVLYLWQDGELKRLSKETLDCLNHQSVRKAITPAFPDQLIKTAAKHNLTYDSIHILDDYELQCFVSGVNAPRVLDVNDLKALKETVPVVVPMLKQAIPPVMELRNSVFSYQPTLMMNQLAQEFPQATLVRSYRQLDLDKEETTQLIKDNVFSLNGASFEWSQLAEIEDLVLSYFYITAQDLQSVLIKTSHLKELAIEGCKIQDQVNWDEVDLSTLEVLYISETELRAQDLQTWLAKTQHLKELILKDCNLLDEVNWNELDLSSLKIVNLSPATLSAQNLQSLLAKTPYLKELLLEKCDVLDQVNWDELDLSTLEVLKLYPAALSAQMLQRLLGKAPHLKQLILYSSQILDQVNWDELDLSTLEVLNLHPDNFSAHTLQSTQTLQRLLSKTPHLKELSLSGCNILDQMGWEELDLSALELLILSSCNISATALQHLLAKASHLKELSLRNCDTLAQVNWEELDLSALEKLRIYSTDLTAQGLQRLLAKTPHLKELTVHKCQILDQADWGNLDLSSLKLLRLSPAALSAQSLQSLLAKASHLKKLTLTDCKILDQVNWEEIDLSTLEGLDITKATISEQTLKKIVAKAPKLKYLNVDDCKNLAEVNWEAFDLSSIKIFRNSEFHRSQENSVVEPLHDPMEQLQFQPTREEDFRFKFKGKNKSLNQQMIIEKLSQYLTLTVQHAAIIPKIQDGICLTLAHFFLTQEPSAWDALLRRIQRWDGSKQTLTNNEELKADFETLLEHVQKYQLGSKYQPETYLGDNLSSFLESHQEPLILINSWHAIAVNYLKEENVWIVYDSLFPEGPRRFTQLSELQDQINKSLGKLVSVTGEYSQEPGIHDPETFLKDGGLLTLIQSGNAQAMLKQLLPMPAYSPKALDGILLRSMKGTPAWAHGISNPKTTAYTVSLVQEFVKAHPDNYIQRLQQSLDALSPIQRHECIVALTQAGAYCSDKSLINQLCSGLRKHTSKDYERQLETWRKIEVHPVSPQAYFQSVVQTGEIKKRLLELGATESTQALQLSLLQHCHSISRPVYCINSPDDLVCLAAYVQRVGNEGVLRKGPGGSLHDFLMQHQDKDNPPVLVVNYEHFSADDIVRFNSLLDSNRMADGTPLPEHALVLGLINPDKPGCYQGADFYSRFDKVERCPLTNLSLPAIPEPIALAQSDERIPINLGHATDWEERLLGRWMIKKDRLIFEEGELEKALRSGKPIELQNAPWDSEEFQQFWHQARARGEVLHAGKSIRIPPEQIFYRSEGYHWSYLAPRLQLHAGIKAGVQVLNPGTLSSFYQQFICDNATATLDSLSGLLQQHQGTLLEVNLTRSLNADEWGLLLAECEKHQVTLRCHTAPGVTFPNELGKDISTSKHTLAPDNVQVISSSDPALTMEHLTHKNKDWVIIDVSECEVADLLLKFDGKLNEQTLRFEFTKKIGAINAALTKGKKILLHGNFSAELMDHLAPLLLSPEGKQAFVLVSNNAEQFNYTEVKHYEVTLEEKKQGLLQFMNASQAEVEYLFSHTSYQTESYNQLRARLSYMRAFYGTECLQWPKEESDKAWQGMEQASITFRLDDFDAEHSQEKAEAFTQKRLDSVQAILRYSPFVFLTGPTAVGKSTFVEKQLGKLPHTTLYQSESQMLAWAKDTTSKYKILFLDEANLSSHQWSEFEGLFNKPPGIVIAGTYYPLSEQHKVVFAGNPANYGGERHLAPLFAAHGNAVAFEPMSLEFIYEYLLKPVFSGTALEQESSTLALPILNIYRFMCQHAHDEVLISPRELQMMALLVHAYAVEHPQGGLQAARHYAYQLAKPLVPEQQRAQFDSLFKPKEELPPNKLPEEGKKSKFLFTPARQPVIQQLNDLLTLRASRRHGINDTQKYGGLGGIVLEGEPGQGKSELVIALLRDRGYEESKSYQGSPNLSPADKIFYRMPVSMQIEDKKQLLLKAFHEGAVVIIDEINSSPVMERLLNDLLMGKTPENKRPNKPGFLLIGTQNPPSMAGRQKPSKALESRLISMLVAPYPPDEMQRILIAKGVLPQEAALLVDAYEKNVKKAQKEHLTPAPTFRDVLRIAETLIEGNKAAIQPNIKKPTEFEVIHNNKDDHQKTISRLSEYIKLHEQKKRTYSAREAGFFPQNSDELRTQISAAQKSIQILQGTSNVELSAEEINALEHNQGGLNEMVGDDIDFIKEYQKTLKNIELM